ncbi:hypothetical protein MTF65_13420 [Streptomyces sp. APSN-46.1]|uniref:hypothetical protein n=1 Tax=Streptomyces sp. APSN-46.1 TaxID=2929049 RepID=UPI001FB1F41A|nr:hypothetical protein [Streptomyces sp. APSN-46.1]MCJ1678329.1 hypothetical protein [Streptomyces sp. APSN-46.1]
MNHEPDLPDLPRLLRELSAVEPGAGRRAGEGGPGPDDAAEPLDGPGFEVETRSVAGMHTVVAITAEDRPPSEAERVLLRSVVRALLDLAGYESGSARTRVVLTKHGYRITACRTAPVV